MWVSNLVYRARHIRASSALNNVTLSKFGYAQSREDAASFVSALGNGAACGVRRSTLGHTTGARALVARHMVSFSTRSEEQLDRELAFVDRYAETFDVLFPNFVNHEALRVKNKSAKMKAPVAAQPPGMGKTILGENLIAVLRRPREGAALQDEVARRLLQAWSWRGAMHNAQRSIAAALADTREENLLMRTLRVCFPHHVGSLERLKDSTPVIVCVNELPRPEAGLGFDGALGLLIFARAMDLDIEDASTQAAFNAAVPLRSSTGAVKVLIRDRGPLLIVLDDITDLQRSEFSAYFASEGKPSPLHNAMTQLSQTLQRLHRIPDCFIFCTGRSLWLSTQALVGATSPLFVTPLLLSPLSAGDVLEMLRLTGSGIDENRALEFDVGVVPAMLPYLAERSVSVTGGMGRPLQFLLRALQQQFAGHSPAATPSDVDAALERAWMRLSGVGGLVLRISWDGPAAGVRDVPGWPQQSAS